MDVGLPSLRVLARGATRARIKILLWASLIAAACGVLEAGEPVDDLLRATRNAVTSHKVDSPIVIVFYDDESYQRLGGYYSDRTYSAKLVERLMQAGARRVIFDSAFSIPLSKEGDAAFIKVLEKYPQRIFLGAAQPRDGLSRGQRDLVPIPQFQERAELLSMTGGQTPFGLSAKLAYGSKIGNRIIPSISTKLSDVNTPAGGYYRPDWSISFASFSSVSFVSALDDNSDLRPVVRNKDVLIGASAFQSGDVWRLGFDAQVPGVLFHAVGAETLRRGVPVNLGWTPFTLLAVLASAAALWGSHRQAAAAYVLTAAAVVIIPGLADPAGFRTDVAPAIALLAFVGWRQAQLRAVTRASLMDHRSGLPNASALVASLVDCGKTLVVMRVANVTQVISSFDKDVQRELFSELCRRVRLDPTVEGVFHNEDMLAWMTELPRGPELERHLQGLHNLVSRSLRVDDCDLALNVTFGVDCASERSPSGRIASAALASQSASWERRLLAYSDFSSDDAVVRDMTLIAGFDRALAGNEFYCVYQPQVDLNTGAMVGVETLVRWRHPDHGVLLPGRFLAAIDDATRSLALTLFVLDRACAFAARLAAVEQPARVAVNVPTAVFLDPAFPSHVEAALGKHGITAQQLVLEVTEDQQLPSMSTALRAAYEELGVEISLDDFGAGSATLERVRALRPAELKVDRQFVSGLDRDGEKRALVEAAVGMAQSLGCRVVAEGIERESELPVLRALGCDVGQGYFLGEPVSDIELLHGVSRGVLKRTSARRTARLRNG